MYKKIINDRTLGVKFFINYYHWVNSKPNVKKRVVRSLFKTVLSNDGTPGDTAVTAPPGGISWPSTTTTYLEQDADCVRLIEETFYPRVRGGQLFLRQQRADLSDYPGNYVFNPIISDEFFTRSIINIQYLLLYHY